MIPLFVKARPKFEEQIYGDNDGEYRVIDIQNYAFEKKIPIQEFDVKELAKNNLQVSPEDWENPEEMPGSPKFTEIANKTDLTYPILVIQYPDGLWIADGVHRLYKAQQSGLKTIKGQLLHKKDLKDIPKISPK